MTAEFEYVFPAIRGVQAQREYYVSMCPLRLIPKLFTFDEEELPPDMRAQRKLNLTRIPAISRYLIENKDNYVFSSITASVNGPVIFEPIGDQDAHNRVGSLRIDMNAQFIINDGQHRRGAIEAALKEEPSLGDETISVVFFIDRGLERCQQMFVDLNKHAIKPSASLNTLYDQREDISKIAKAIALESTTFKGVVEMEKSTLARRSRKLVTLSAIKTATACLLAGKELKNIDDATSFSIKYWDELGKHISEWQLVSQGRITAGEIREGYVNCHAIVLQVLGIIGNKLCDLSWKESKERLKLLEQIDWSRSNAKVWEGRAMIGGRMSKSSNNITLTSNYIKSQIGLDLSPEEQRVEDAYLRGENV
ncbi:DNA sulfur modification protein DndB [gamma proteobacterium NOR5-3]|nr:DNA sulfur modification protein DndB [gamma proteobacterium NOR5-3]